MNESLNIENIRATLLYQAQLREISATPEERAEQKRVADGLSSIPVKKMMEQAIYINDNLLPAVEKKTGKGSPDFDFFAAVYRSLLYAIVVMDRYESLQAKFTRLKVTNIITTENLALLEAELQKYCTLEDFFLSEGRDYIAKGIKLRAEALLRENK